MDIRLFLMRNRTHCEQNHQDQLKLGNDRNAAFWHGRALSFQAVEDALKGGIITPEGIDFLTLNDAPLTAPAE